MGVAPGAQTGYAVSARYLVRAAPDDLAAVEVVRISDHKVLLTHRPADEKRYVTTFAGLAGNHLVLVDADIADDSTSTDQAFVYNLNTGRRTSLSGAKAVPPVSAFGEQGSISGNTWYYSSQTPGNYVNCVAALNLDTLRGRLVDCAPAKGEILYINTSDSGATWDIFTSRSFAACRIGRGIRDGKLYDVGLATDCRIFDTGMLDGWSLWSDQSRSDLQPYIPLTAESGKATVALGSLHPQSLVICGGYAYWRTGAAVIGHDDSLVRWRPGDLVPQTVLTETSVPGSSKDNELLWPEGCNDNILTITVTRYYASDPKSTVQVLAIDPSRP